MKLLISPKVVDKPAISRRFFLCEILVPRPFYVKY